METSLFGPVPDAVKGRIGYAEAERIAVVGLSAGGVLALVLFVLRGAGVEVPEEIIVAGGTVAAWVVELVRRRNHGR